MEVYDWEKLEKEIIEWHSQTFVIVTDIYPKTMVKKELLKF